MGGGKLWRSRRGAGQHRRLPRVAKGGHSVAEPLLARNARLTQEASQQSDADVAFVAVRNNDRDIFPLHLRMAPSCVRPVKPESAQTAHEFTPRHWGKAGHGTPYAGCTIWFRSMPPRTGIGRPSLNRSATQSLKASRSSL